MPAQKSSSVIQQLLDGELSAVQDKIGDLLDLSVKRGSAIDDEMQREADAMRAAGYAVIRQPPSRFNNFTPQEREVMNQLQARAKRLRQVQKYFQEDPELMHLVDAAIAKNAKAMQRQQVFISGGLAVLSLVVGWLLSAVSPVTAMHLFGR